MTPPLSLTGRNEKFPARSASAGVPLPLRRQAWLAAALLLCPWLVSLFLCSPLVRQAPLALLALLPGLLVAIRLARQLLTHLATNHRCGEADRLFPTLGAATWITLVRVAAIVALAGFLPLAMVRPGPPLPLHLAWAPGLIYLGVALADLLDGLVARKQQRETALGQRLDIEADAAGLLVALLAAVILQRLPPLSLLVGLAYYFFIFGIWWRARHHLPLVALQSRPYARIIAGFQMGLVALALLPLFNPPFTTIAALLVMTPLLVGFFRDWLGGSCRLRIDSNQHTSPDRWAGLVLTRYLPLGLRLTLLVGAIVALAAGDVFPVPPLWLRAASLCCLLAGLGCLGRSAALLLTLSLASPLSPFGTDLPALGLFAVAAALMLTGPGPLALWSPEERILYRRTRGASAAGSEAA